MGNTLRFCLARSFQDDNVLYIVNTLGMFVVLG